MIQLDFIERATRDMLQHLQVLVFFNMRTLKKRADDHLTPESMGILFFTKK